MPQCFPHSPKTMKKLINFRRKSSPIKNLHWTHRMQFWQTYRQNFAESTKNLRPETKIKETIQGICFQKKTSKNIPWTLENSFDNPTRLISPKIRIVFLKDWKQLKVLKTLWKRKIFLQKCPLDTKKTVLTTMSKSFYKFLKVFPQSPLVGVNFLEEKDHVIQEDPLNECRKQFFKWGGTLSDRSPQSFSSELEKFVKEKIFFRKQTFLEKFCCSSRMHFWQLLWSSCANFAKFSAHSWKTLTKLKKFIKNISIKNHIRTDKVQF